MAFFQIDISDFYNYLSQDSNTFDHLIISTVQARESAQQNLQSLLQFKLNKILQEAEQLEDMTTLLNNIIEYSEQLRIKFEQSNILKLKLRDIEDEISNYFQCKQGLSEIEQEYQQDILLHKEMKENVKSINKNDLFRLQAQNLLQEFASLTKKLADYNTFQTDLTDLKKIEERFKMLESEEDYLEYQLVINNKPFNGITQTPIQLLCNFVQILGQTIKILKSGQDRSIFLSFENETVREEVIMEYKFVLLLKIFDTIPTLIIIDKEKSTGQVLCSAQSRQQIKQYLENFKTYLSNIKIQYTLLKPDLIQEQIYYKIIEKLIEFKIINQIGVLQFQEMLVSIQKVQLYQKDLPDLDCFQFLDYMHIELI